MNRVSLPYGLEAAARHKYWSMQFVQTGVTYGLWALNREVNHKVDTLAGRCLAVERDEGGGRVERGGTGGLSVGLQEAENWGVATRRRPLYTPGACCYNIPTRHFLFPFLFLNERNLCTIRSRGDSTSLLYVRLIVTHLES